MSTDKLTADKSYARLASKDFQPGSGADKRRVIEKIDLAELAIDDSYGADCDPYNSTGQHLVAEIKKKYDDDR